jgi:hypothetical protein
VLKILAFSSSCPIILSQIVLGIRVCLLTPLEQRAVPLTGEGLRGPSGRISSPEGHVQEKRFRL